MTATYDDKTLENLLDVFGDAFSLEDIASAYCQAGKGAAELLNKSKPEGYCSSSSATCRSRCETKNVDSLDGSYVMVRHKSAPVTGNMKKSKQIWRPVSVITPVSGQLVKDCVSSKPLENGPPCQTKALKVESWCPPTSYAYESNLGNKKQDFWKKEMEDFLFDLLGVGFKLDRSQIRTVLAQCRYDVQKSMGELLNISAENSARHCSNANGLTRKDRIFHELRFEKVVKSSRDSVYTQRRHPGPSINNRDEEVAVNNNGTELSDTFRSRIDREMEVLAALFTPAERASELPKRSGTAGTTLEVLDVAERSTDELKLDVPSSQKGDDADADPEVDNFQVLRRAVKDYLVTKKEYYRAAVEAHAKGDHARAAKLVEQGEFFHQKAQQADAESLPKMFEIRPNVKKKKKQDDTFILDLHDCGPKEAIRLLKCHLPMLSAFRYCTLIISTNDKDITKGPRKRKIMKLLEEQSIQWIQGSEAGTILISSSEVEPGNSC